MQKIKKKLERIIYFFNQPFPEDSSFLENVKIAFIVAVFIFLFLYTFQPFGLHLVGELMLLYSFYFALITFVVTVLYDVLLIFIIRVKTNLPSWTLGSWFLSVIGLIFFISIANAFLILKVNPESQLSMIHFLRIMRATFLIGVFPLIFFGAIKVSSRTKENENIAKAISVKQGESVKRTEAVFEIEVNGKQKSFNVIDFVFAEAMQNYLTVHHLNDEQHIVKTVIRSTLKSFLEKIIDPRVIQSHRSYIVNCHHIKDISGNAQGLKLRLQFSNIIVPVSRKYIPLFRSKYN